MNKTANFALMKFCMNCFHPNKKELNVCEFCKNLLVGEIDSEEYFKRKNEMELERLKKKEV